MGTKYTIEVEDKPFELLSEYGFTSEKLYRVKGFNSLVFDWNGLNKLTPYTEPDLEQVNAEKDKIYDEARARGYDEGRARGYQEGLFDAWEAARKIGSNSMCSLKEMGFKFEPQSVGYNPSWYVVQIYSASECIEKIRQYEQEKEEQIQVGDEVRNIQHGWTAVVSAIDRECMTLMDTNGKLGDGYDMNRFIKTGRHFPEIAEVLKKMRESE